MKEVLNGGYNVHPVPPPNSEIKERIRKRYERERIKKLLLAPMRDSYKKLKIMLSAVYFSYKRSSIITGYAEKHFRNLPFC